MLKNFSNHLALECITEDNFDSEKPLSSITRRDGNLFGEKCNHVIMMAKRLVDSIVVKM